MQLTRTLSFAISVELLALAGSAQAASAFTFTDAEFMPANNGIEAAHSFIADQLTRGLPMALAIARVEKAQASCHAAAGGAEMVICEHYTLDRPVGGDLGENVWTVHLTPGPNGLLDDATVSRSRVGMPGYMDTAASSH
jgi:hypothetical protein